MHSDNSLPRILTSVALVMGGAWIIGLLIGQPLEAVLVALLLYLGWHLRNLLELSRWLRSGRMQPPDTGGLWGNVFDELYRYRRRHRARRRRLADLLARFRESVDAMPDAAVVLGPRGEMEWWNHAATELLGLRWPQDYGQRVDNLIRSPEFKRFLRESGRRAPISLASPLREDLRLELRLVPYGNQQRLLLARNVTRLLRLEAMRRDFIANISHELRTPLTVVRGLSETLADDDQLDADMRRSLDLILGQTLRMQRLVDDLLLLSRLETEGRRPEEQDVDVPLLLDSLLDDAKAVAARANQTVTLEAEPALGLRGDATELRSAFSNLLFNALKYTPAGGEIRVVWRSEGEGACLSVIDNGPGIAPYHLPRLTERFYRPDSARTASTGGTGLGLAIVKHVLGRHHAQLKIASWLGEGSTFSCHFQPAAVIRQSPVLT